MKNKLKTNLASQKGQSLVEFAISLTFMLILLAGAVDFGIGLFHYVAMRDAAQEGALVGSMNPPPVGTYTCPAAEISVICTRMMGAAGTNSLLTKIFADADTVTTVQVAGGACEGNGITVTLQYDYDTTMPFIETFIGSDHIRLRATVTDTILTPPCP